MSLVDPRAQAALDAAMVQVRTAAATAAARVLESLSTLAQNATKIDLVNLSSQVQA